MLFVAGLFAIRQWLFIAFNRLFFNRGGKGVVCDLSGRVVETLFFLLKLFQDLIHLFQVDLVVIFSKISFFAVKISGVFVKKPSQMKQAEQEQNSRGCSDDPKPFFFEIADKFFQEKFQFFHRMTGTEKLMDAFSCPGWKITPFCAPAAL